MSDDRRLLKAALRGVPDEQADLEARLLSPNDQMARALDEASTDELLKDWSAGREVLEPEEADAIFDAALRQAKPAVPSWRRRARLIVPVMAAAAALLLWFLGRSADTSFDPGGFKGAGGVELHALLGEQKAGAPAVGRRLQSGERLPSGAQVILRYRLARPGTIYVFAQGAGQPQLLHQAKRAVGLFELTEGGQLMALQPGRLGSTVRIVALVSQRALAPAALASMEALEDGVLEALCPGCPRTQVLLRPEQP